MMAIIPITHAISHYQTQLFMIYEGLSQAELAKVGGISLLVSEEPTVV